METEEKELYQAAYCGLCHAMARRHGWLARYTLNYDFTFLALLFSAGGGEIGAPKRCPAHPLRPKNGCLFTPALDVAADESMILTWHKLRDDIRDGRGLRRMLARCLCVILQKGYHRAATARPEFDRKVSEGLAHLSRLEAEHSPHLDRVADTFASILSGAVSSKEERFRRVMTQLLYHIGRWIYLIDAWDDLQEDRRAGRYNPLSARFHGKAEEEREYIAVTMTHSLNLAVSAANLMDFGRYTGVIDNILQVGLPAVQQMVLRGQGKALQKKRWGKNQ